MIYFTSDTHFNHSKLAEIRNFKNTNEMNKYLLELWNDTLTDKDIVIHLGDVYLSQDNKIEDILSKLRGSLYLVPGNHDDDKKLHMLSRYFNILPSIFRLHSKVIKPYTNTEVECGCICCHYPLADWGLPIWHLHGHMHGDKLPYDIKGAIFDVSIDKEYKIYSYTDIKQLISKPVMSSRHNKE